LEKTNRNRDFKVDLNTTREEDLMIENLLRELISLPRKSKSKDGIDIERLIESFSVSTAKDFFIDLKSLDQQINLNAYLSRLNKSMFDRNIKRVVGVVYTLENWRKDKKVLKLPVISKPISWVYFLLFRVLPKIRLFNKLTVISKNRLYSNAEILGRFCYHGFDIENFVLAENNSFIFVLSRKDHPSQKPIQHGLFIKLPRIGKNGKEIHVYKLRTMHAYSEYLHRYMIQKHGFNQNGKINNDFRLAGWGRSLRKFWVDELPQLANLLKGDMKLVGVRPVSKAYFDSLPKENQELRLKEKPGCIPPYVALNIGTTKEDVLKAEMIYLSDKSRFPIIRDTKYFFTALYNILIKGLRSS